MHQQQLVGRLHSLFSQRGDGLTVVLKAARKDDSFALMAMDPE